MKKIYLIAFTVLATLALGSCIQDIEDNGPIVSLGENGIAFVMNSRPATRAGDGSEVVSRGVTVPLGVTEDGTSLYLEETVTLLDAVAPVTRGTPAYTENLGVLYAGQLGVHADKGSFGDLAFENDSQAAGDGSWRYFHVYDSDPWPNETDAVQFYLRMPATINGLTTTSGGTTVTNTIGYNADGTITVPYTSPATAAKMQDILFGCTSMTKPEYKTLQASGGAHVTLYHALTGVKFAIGNTKDDISDNTIKIDTICFVGLKDKGTCTISVPASDATSANVATWEIDDELVNETLSSGAYADTVMFSQGGSFGEAGGAYPESFAKGGNTANLNKTDGSQTFWLIPQTMTDDVRLMITYTFAGKQSTGFLDLGKALNGIKWEAGELRTYTIRIEDVNLKITDKVHGGSGEKPVIGSYKDSIVITNTGNTHAFIRAAIVGQWLDENNNPVFGFTDNINNLYLVESWYEDQFVNHNGTHGVFVDLPGYKNNTAETEYGNPLHNWYYNDADGYYYYTKVVAPGKATGETGVDASGNLLHDPLFTSFTVSKIPKAEIAGQAVLEVNMHFTLEIATQAISAVKSDGTIMADGDYAAAWAAAKEGNKYNN